VSVYKKLGISKKYYSSVSSKDFAQLNQAAQLENNLSQLQHCDLFKSSSAVSQKSLLSFNDNGYAILEEFLSHKEVNEINNSIDNLLENGTLEYKYGNKIMFAFRHAQEIEKIGKNKKLQEILDVLLGRKAILFQSINFTAGSEQASHSDSIHMTTYPLGGLLGVWFALEDITENNGPLHYYPGSHKLPYYLNKDYDNEGTRWFIGDKDYQAYENMIDKKIVDQKLKKKRFLAKKGDVLIWHANLIHGGDAHIDKNKTRKSMVFHYFGKDVVCYHEISQRPALMIS
jgi:ectoine hydroxylase-related dioxygenase (phytanoyl-CoA dioxygenase family)